MFIRIHSESDSRDRALINFSKVLDPINHQIVSQQVLKCEQYWKIDTMYVTEAEVRLTSDFSREDLTAYLETLSANWHVSENPLDAITSKQMGEISIENTAMITIMFD